MTGQPLDRAVELLDRSLAYTWGTLSEVRDDHLSKPTPCSDWDLAQLLDHMSDAVDAFTEAASGYVRLDSHPTADHSSPRVVVLRDKACALLGAWAAHRPVDPVRVGDLHLAGPVLVATAALEITVHGWDVTQATGGARRVPEELAAALLQVAEGVLTPSDRQGRFAPRLAPRPDAGADTLLLGYLGRSAGSPFGGDLARGGVPHGLAS